MTATDQAERDVLMAYLNSQRRHVLGILEGLDEEALRRPILPSGWSCLGLVHHLAVDEERFWFRAVIDGEQAAIDELAQIDNAWIVPEHLTSQDVFELYRHEIDLADDVIATNPLDAPPVWWPSDLFGDWRLDDARQIVLHVIVETACHAGHLDAARELTDGRQWLVLT